MGTIVFNIKDGKLNEEWFLCDIDRFKYNLHWIYEDSMFYTDRIPLEKIAIRKFIEKNLSEDVLITDRRFEKRTHKSAWNTSGSGCIKYLDISFEDEADWLAFKLNFSHCKTDKDLEHIKNTKTSYEIEKEETEARGEYWNDRRD